MGEDGSEGEVFLGLRVEVALVVDEVLIDGGVKLGEGVYK